MKKQNARWRKWCLLVTSLPDSTYALQISPNSGHVYNLGITRLQLLKFLWCNRSFICPLPFQFQYLHRVLVAEVNALQGMAAIGQRPLLMEVSLVKIIWFQCFQWDFLCHQAYDVKCFFANLSPKSRGSCLRINIEYLVSRRQNGTEKSNKIILKEQIAFSQTAFAS